MGDMFLPMGNGLAIPALGHTELGKKVLRRGVRRWSIIVQNYKAPFSYHLTNILTADVNFDLIENKNKKKKRKTI